MLRHDGSYLIEAGWVYADDGAGPRLLRDATVLVAQGRIAEVRAGPHSAALPRLVLPGHVVLPGLISGHTHVAAGTPTRGIIEGGRSFALPLQLVEAHTRDSRR